MRFTTFADEEESDEKEQLPTIVPQAEAFGSSSLANLCCLFSGTEAKNKGDDDVRNLWKTQVQWKIAHFSNLGYQSYPTRHCAN
ncbi:unnamed protein product [Gongylonema pulchrum]|uniref:Uncharacterized protein n=1 Tax=Gongylonema pulchrum TaxID=637853 RepID=A0A183DK83_9BILA|nr:unnamed protein product [Gongylonema pulchrum]